MSKSFFFIGIGANGQSPIRDDEGHVRITQMDHGFVSGGTKETHDQTVDVCMRVNESVSQIHRTHGDRPDPRYFRDAVREAFD